LDKKTLIKTFQRIYPNGKPNKICSKLFNAFDRDKNNKIDFSEYLIAISHLSSQDVRKKLELTFQIYDSDRNGLVNKKELEKMMIAILELNGVRDLKRGGENSPKTKVENVFKRFNKHIDDSIEESEFINGCLNDPYLVSLFADYRV
jgi:Ca2+-binding EF-hand superfamily protein